jgi:hypothetical protein
LKVQRVEREGRKVFVDEGLWGRKCSADDAWLPYVVVIEEPPLDRSFNYYRLYLYKRKYFK